MTNFFTDKIRYRCAGYPDLQGIFGFYRNYLPVYLGNTVYLFLLIRETQPGREKQPAI